MKLINSDPQKFYQRHKPEEVENWSFGKLRGRVFATGSAWEHNRSLRESGWDGRTVELKKFVGSDKELYYMLGSVDIDILDSAGEGIPLRKVKHTAKEWVETIKELKQIKPYDRRVPSRIKKMLKEEFK